MFKSNGGMEPWRQWLLSTGWDGTQSIKTHPDTKLPLDSREKNWINNWIATYGNLAVQITDLMTKEDGFYQKKMNEYDELKGQQKQADFPIKNWIVHQELDRIHNTVFKNALRAFRRYERENTIVGREMKNRDFYLKTGQGDKALEKQRQIRELLNY
jgi:ribosomal protein S21